MVRWSSRKRLLEPETNTTQFELKDVTEPNLYKDLFPYDRVPRIDFDRKIVSLNPADEIFITDTTFRDGQQARPPYTVEQIVDLFRLLSKLGGENGIIRQSEFFLYTPKDKEAVERCRDLGFKYPEITGWIRAKKEDVPLVKEMGLEETGILTSCSDYHIFLKMNLTRKKALDQYLGVVKEILNAGIKPRCHFEDLTRADIYGFCIPFAMELMKLREESGIDIKIRLCDTLGFGVTNPEAALPRGVPKLVTAFTDDAGVPGHLLEWHGHNDFYKAHVNASTVWLYGCSSANGSLLGLGERTGNTPIEALIMEYISLRGTENGIDTTVITDIAHYFENELGVVIPDNMPFIGTDFNVTRAGIHVDGLIKNEEIYNIFDTTKLLKRPVLIELTDKSGKSGLVHWINTRLELDSEHGILKSHPGISKIHKWVTQQYESGRITSISHEEMERKVRKYLPDLFMSDMEKIKLKAGQASKEVLELLVAVPDMKSMNPKLQEPSMQHIVDDNPAIQFAYVVDINGKKTTRNVTDIGSKAKYENYGVGIDYSDRGWFIQPIQNGRMYVSDFYISKMTGALCITASGPIIDDKDEIVGVCGVDIRFEEWASRVEDIAEATKLALKAEYDAKKKEEERSE